MRNHRMALVVAVAIAGALCGGSPAHAGGQPISGKKLLLKSSAGGEKLVLLSKDVLVSAGANGTSADPRCYPDGSHLGGAIALDDGTNRATLTLNCQPEADPSTGWSSNGAGTLYKFKSKQFPLFPNPGPKIAKVKSGLLKTVSKDLGGFPVPNGPATVRVEVRVGLNEYCMEFTGTGDGSKFLVKDAPAPSDCPNSDPGCTGESVGGACWYLGAPGASCDAVCAGHGKLCDAATANFAGTGPGGTLAGCTAVVAAMLIDPAAFDGLGHVPPVSELGCIVAPPLSVSSNVPPTPIRFVGATPTTCAASTLPEYLYSRVCACN